jgi:hypothetical protein
MEIMTTPTTPWASLPSYAPSFVGSADCTVDVRGGACGVFEADFASTTPLGADLVRHTNLDIRNKDIRNKDIRPGSRAWSPPV